MRGNSGAITAQEVAKGLCQLGLSKGDVVLFHSDLKSLAPPRELQGDVENGLLSMGHARALLQVANPERRHQLRDRIVADELSVRVTEEQARQLAAPGGKRRRSPRRPDVDPNLQGLLDTLRDHLKTKVMISGTAARGKLEIEFYGPEELHRITSAILDAR